MNKTKKSIRSSHGSTANERSTAHTMFSNTRPHKIEKAAATTPTSGSRTAGFKDVMYTKGKYLPDTNTYNGSTVEEDFAPNI